MATNPYSYGSLGQRWTVGEPTSKSLLDVSRVKADANRWALEQLIVDPDDTANFVLTAPGLNIDSNTLYVDSANNSVGFGLTNPNDYAFNGTPSWVASGGAGNASVIVVSGTTSIGYLAFADGTTGTDRYSGNIQYNHSTNTMSFRTNGGVEAMSIDSAQDVSLPAGYLKVSGNPSAGTISSNGNGQIGGLTGNGLYMYGKGSTYDLALANANTSVALAIPTGGSATPDVYIPNSLGIGTSSPTRLLSLYSNSPTSVFQSFTNSSTGNTASDGAQIGIDSNNDLQIGQLESGKLIEFYNNGSLAMVIDSSQRVGIGSSSPDEALRINGSSDGNSRIRIQNQGTDIGAFGSAGGWIGGGANANDLLVTSVGANNLVFGSNSTERARITSDGDLLIGETSNQIARVYSKTSTSGDYAYMGVTTHADRGPVFFHNTNASFNDIACNVTATRAATTAYDLARWNSGAGADVEFKFTGNGEAYADGAWNGSGADYQEYFESNTGDAAEVGRAIVLDGGKVRYYNADTDSTDDIMGVTRPQADNKNSAVVGNTAWNHWTDKYLTDDWGVYLREDVTVWTYANEKGEEFAVYERDELAKDSNWTPPEGATSSTESVRKLNPDYDESLDAAYESREERDEWWLIGLLGQIQVKAGEPVNPRWIKMKNISDAVELYYVR